MYNGCVGAVGSPKETDARCEAPLQTHSPSTPEGRSVFHTTGQDQQKDDPAAGADVREEVLEERVKFIHAAIIQEGRRVVIRNPSAPMESLLWLLVRIGTQPSEKDRLTAGLHLIDARPLV